VAGQLSGDETAKSSVPQSGIGFMLAEPSKRRGEDEPTLLTGVVTDKTSQREREGYLQWHVKPESVQQISIEGRSPSRLSQASRRAEEARGLIARLRTRSKTGPFLELGQHNKM
jgi:hypothetical protein